MIKIADYPELCFISWFITGVDEIDEETALGIYERNWIYVDTDRLTDEEKALIERLILKYRGGGQGWFAWGKARRCRIDSPFG